MESEHRRLEDMAVGLIGSRPVGERGLGLVVHFPSRCVTRMNTQPTVTVAVAVTQVTVVPHLLGS